MRPATFQVLSSLVCLVATILDNADLEDEELEQPHHLGLGHSAVGVLEKKQREREGHFSTDEIETWNCRRKYSITCAEQNNNDF